MSIFNDKTLKSVAEAASKIMAETSHGTKPESEKEKKLAALAHPKDKVTHKDVLVGRGVLKREQVEKLDEYQSKGGVYRHKGTYGSAKGAEYGDTDYEKENEMQKDADKKKPARKAYGARQNFVRSKRVNESFIDMLEAYTNGGLKGLDDLMYEEVELIEEPDNEQFTKELEDQKASMEGKRKQPSVAAASTQGVKTMPEEVEQLEEDPLALRSLYSTDPKKQRLLKTQKGREAAAKRNVPELKNKIKSAMQYGRHVKPNLPEQFEDDFDLDEAAMSHQAKTTMRHIKNPTSGEKQASKDIKPGIAGYRDRIAMLKSAEARGVLNKEEVKVTQLPPGPEPKGKWGKGLSRPRFQKGDGPQKTRNTGDDDYTDRRMRDAENRGTLDNREHGRRLRGEEVEQMIEQTRVIAKHGDVEVHAHRGDDEGYMVDVRKNGKKIAQGDHDSYAGTTFISHPSFGKGQKGFRSHEELAKHFSTMKEHIDLDERTLTEPEAKKKEEYVKGMKKKLSGFKQRYGERAKEVMYATATKMAKKED